MYENDRFYNNTDDFISSETDHPFREKEKPVRPYRGISTECLPQELKNQLKPHWSNWILASPGYARNREHCDKTQIFARRKNKLVQVASINEIELGQEHYVLRQKPKNKKKFGGGVVAFAPAAEKLVFDEKYDNPEESVSITDPSSQSGVFVGKDSRLVEEPDGTLTLYVSGHVTQSTSVRAKWDRAITDGSKPQSAESLPVPTSRGEKIPWKTGIPDVKPGKCAIIATTPGGKIDTKQIEIIARRIEIGELLYRPDENAFYLIARNDYDSFTTAAKQHDTPIAQLSQAYTTNNQEQVDQAKEALDRKLEPLIDAKVDSSQLVEVVGLRGRKTYFIEQNDIQNGWRKYVPVRGGAEALELVNNSNSFDFKKLKEKFDPRKYEKTANAEYSWTLIEPHSTSLGRWAESMNRNLAEILDNQDNLPEDRRFDYSAQAQVLRYSYGTSLNSNFDLKKREIDISFESETSLALAEGKLTGNWYLPDAEGVEVKFTDVPTRGSRAGQTIECNIGSFRLKVTTELAGFAGASLQASAGLTLGMKEGKVNMRGSVKQSDNEDENYAGAGGEAFAGIKGTGTLKGSGDWKNPEKNHDWVELLELGASITAAAGLTLEGDFGVDYQDGRFVVHFSVHGALGIGGGGKFACTIGVEHIVDFMVYLYHELKNEDFHFVGVFTQDAFDSYVAISTFGLVKGEDIRTMYEMGEKGIRKMVEEVRIELETLQTETEEQKRLKKLAEHILANKQNLSCHPPEAKSQLLYSLSTYYAFSRQEKQEEAIIAILGTAQTRNDYVEMVSHCSPGGQKISLVEGEARLRKILDFTEQHQFDRLLLELRMLDTEPQINTAAIYNDMTQLA